VRDRVTGSESVRRVLAAVVSPLAGLLLFGLPAARADEPSSEARARAQAAFDAGLKSKEQGDTAGACERFEASVALAPSPHAWLQVGTCRQSTDLSGALAAFEAALREAEGVSDPNRRGAYQVAARERIAQVTRRVPLVIFRASPTPGARVHVTGSDVTGSPGAAVAVDRFGEALRFNPGQYQVRVSAEGSHPHEFELALAEGEQHEVLLPALPKAPPVATALAVPVEAAAPVPPVAPQPAVDEGSRYGILPVALLGGGGALVVLGVVSGQLALAERDELREDCPPVAGGDARRCPSAKADDKQRLQRYAVASDVLWVSGAVAAAAGLTLLLLDGPSGSPAEVSAGCFDSGCGVRAAGRF